MKFLISTPDVNTYLSVRTDLIDWTVILVGLSLKTFDLGPVKLGGIVG